MVRCSREERDAAISRVKRFQPNKRSKTSTRPMWSRKEDAAIFSLLSRRYWRRVWIIQEILLARDLVVLLWHLEFSLGFSASNGRGAGCAGWPKDLPGCRPSLRRVDLLRCQEIACPT